MPRPIEERRWSAQEVAEVLRMGTNCDVWWQSAAAMIDLRTTADTAWARLRGDMPLSEYPPMDVDRPEEDMIALALQLGIAFDESCGVARKPEA